MKTLEKPSLFWDVDRSTLNPTEHSDFVIRRVLNRGDIDDIKWILSLYGSEKVRDVFVWARGLSPRSSNFWQAYFNVTPEPYAPGDA